MINNKCKGDGCLVKKDCLNYSEDSDATFEFNIFNDIFFCENYKDFYNKVGISEKISVLLKSKIKGFTKFKY